MRYEPRGLALSAVASVLILVIGFGGAVFLWTRRDQFATVEQPWVFGADGDPMPFAWAVLFALMTSTFVPIILIVLGVISDYPRQTSTLAVGMSTFLAVLLNGTIWSQRALGPDEIGTASLRGPVLAAIIATIVASGLLMLVTRGLRVPADAAQSAAEPDAPVWADRAVEWSGPLRASWLLPGQVVAICGLIGVCQSAAWQTGAGWLVVLNGIVALAALLRAPFAIGRLRIVAGLVLLRGGGFLTWYQIPLERIAEHSVVHVDPRRDYGGLGRRVAPDGTVGYLTGRGQGLRIVGFGGAVIVITVRDAEAAHRALERALRRRWDDSD